MRKLLGLLSRIFSPKPAPVPTPTPAPTPQPLPDPTSDALISAINAERARLGLAPLKADDKLNRIAASWAAAMARASRLSHGDFNGRFEGVYPNTAGAENITIARDIAQVIMMWMGSPPHRANMLGHYNLAGVGFAASNTSAIYWCADFARTE